MRSGLGLLFSVAVAAAAFSPSAIAARKKVTIGYDNYFMVISWSVQLATEFKT
jgi:hypothetical protein